MYTHIAADIHLKRAGKPDPGRGEGGKAPARTHRISRPAEPSARLLNPGRADEEEDHSYLESYRSVVFQATAFHRVMFQSFS